MQDSRKAFEEMERRKAEEARKIKEAEEAFKQSNSDISRSCSDAIRVIAQRSGLFAEGEAMRTPLAQIIVKMAQKRADVSVNDHFLKIRNLLDSVAKQRPEMRPLLVRVNALELETRPTDLTAAENERKALLNDIKVQERQLRLHHCEPPEWLDSDPVGRLRYIRQLNARILREAEEKKE